MVWMYRHLAVGLVLLWAIADEAEDVIADKHRPPRDLVGLLLTVAEWHHLAHIPSPPHLPS